MTREEEFKLEVGKLINEYVNDYVADIVSDIQKENEGLKKSVVSQSSAMLNQQQSIEELENILKDNPSHSDMDAAVFTNNMLQQRIEELEKENEGLV